VPRLRGRGEQRKIVSQTLRSIRALLYARTTYRFDRQNTSARTTRAVVSDLPIDGLKNTGPCVEHGPVNRLSSEETNRRQKLPCRPGREKLTFGKVYYVYDGLRTSVCILVIEGADTFPGVEATILSLLVYSILSEPQRCT
jgi:hypothetical protein